MPFPFIAAAASALGVSTSTVGGGLLSGIMGGLSSLFGGKSKRKQAQQEQKDKLELQRQGIAQTGDETRKTSKYEMELAASMDEYGRARKRGAFKNFGFTVPTDPYAQAQLQGYTQVWKPEDTKLVLPNAAPSSTNLVKPPR